MPNTVIYYPWPDSQTCGSCENGRTINPDTDSEQGACICMVSCDLNTGASCPEYSPVEGWGKCEYCDRDYNSDGECDSDDCPGNKEV